MPRETSNRLVEFALDHIDDALRAVVVLYETDHDVIYLREDLDDNYTPTRFESVVDSFRIEGICDQETAGTLIGEKQAVIHHHDEAFVFQFPHLDCHSILLSVEPEVGSQLRAFVNECQERI